MTMAAFISILFRLLNFAVLVAVLVYVYKKYVRHTLVHGIAQKKKNFKRLRYEHDAVEGQYNKVCIVTQHHEQQYALLREKIGQWKTVVDKKLAQQACEKNDLKRALRDRADIRVKNIKECVIMQRVMPTVLENTYEGACKKFEGKAGQHYLNHILTQLQESK